MTPASNWTPAERLKYGGSLTLDQQEELVAMAAWVDTVDVRPYLDEALGGLPNEDFMEKVIARMRYLADNLRGENKEELKRIISEASELQMQVYRDSCYTEEQIDLAKKELNNGLRGQ